MSYLSTNEAPTTLSGTLVEQIDGHWREIARPRLEGLRDEEYFYDPTGTGDAWTVHPREQQRSEMQAGSGAMVIDFQFPPPEPAPLTTIAWRFGHMIVGILAMRSHGHFDGPEADYMSWDYASTAEGALAQLDTEYARWMQGVRSWSDADLAEPCGPCEGEWAEHSRATLVAHLNRELIHHLAEVALLRDLYTHR